MDDPDARPRAAPSPTSLPVMDAQMAVDAGQQAPSADPDFYTVVKSAARTEALPQVPPSEANGATLVRQRYDEENLSE